MLSSSEGCEPTTVPRAIRMFGLRSTYTHSGERSRPIGSGERWHPSVSGWLIDVGRGGFAAEALAVTHRSSASASDGSLYRRDSGGRCERNGGMQSWRGAFLRRSYLFQAQAAS